MKNLILSLFVLFSLFSCTEKYEHAMVAIKNDSISRDFLITDGKIGPVFKGMKPERLYKIYGENAIKQLIEKDNGETAENKVTDFMVFGKDNQILMVVEAQKQENNTYEGIQKIVLKSNAFRTKQDIGIKSTIRDISEAYSDYSIIQRGKHVYLFIPDIDLYFDINTKDIHGFNDEFIGDISIDSIKQYSVPTAMYVQWYSTNNGVLDSRFWKDITHKFLTWTLVELPSTVILIILFIVLLRLLNFVINRIKRIAINRAIKDETKDTDEELKRITTLSGIIRGIGKIFLWVVFILILLAKININIAPILASAGIVGLAVGFGAQELVRDFISGFFILFDNQLRTGDMAIINGTQGLVEKIELRTISLRDMSGVVHIFQNGKINTLSNMTKEWSAIELEIGVAYKEDIDRVMKVMQKVGDEMFASEQYKNMMLSTAQILGLDNFGDSAISIKVILKTRPMQQWTIKREYQRRLKIAFDKENIEIPFPHISIYTGEVTKPMPIEIKSKE